jgi:hypothetical protein
MAGGGVARCSPWRPSDGEELDGGGKLGGEGAKSFPRALDAAQAWGGHEAAAKQSHQWWIVRGELSPEDGKRQH